MKKNPLTQHWDVLVLGLFTLGCMVLFVANEKGWLLPRRTVEASEFRPSGPDVPGATPEQTPNAAASETPAPAALGDDEDYNPRDLDRHVPPAHQPGVVAMGPNAPLGGLQVFPGDNAWNQPVADAPVDPLSDLIIKTIGAEKGLFPDFGAGYWNGAEIGIPYYVVGGDQPRVPIGYTAYGDQSDPGPFPIPPRAPIEGAPNTDGDRHCIVLDKDNMKLYELFRAFSIADGRMWRADSGAVFDLKSNDFRPLGWTSADAAGLPIFPGLVRYEEVVELGEIKHALRFTVQKTRRAFVHPARHYASRDTNALLPPMGMRVRLKSDFDISGFPPEAQVILRCLKTYGMLLADNGSDWYVSGAPDPRWNDTALKTLKQVKGSDLEVVLMEDVVVD
ncbi:MAG: hypothetical protein KDA90_12755 [Planctomycetaceae bacterium]|nr:hypothetical protein [Planctomycetaceae bacterium]